jgi:transposase-like protein
MPTTSRAAATPAEPNATPTMPSIADPGVQAADAWLRRFQAAVITIMAAVATAVGTVAFFTSYEAIKAYAKTSDGITPKHAWAIPLLVDSFIVIATGAELWLAGQPGRRAWWELAWPRVLLAGAASVSFVLNVAHAQTSAWPARGVAAIPPAALVLSVELLVMIARRAAIARTTRLGTATRTSRSETTVVVRSDQPTMVAPAGDQPVLEATSSTHRQTAPANSHPEATRSAGDHQTDATGDQPTTSTAATSTAATPGDQISNGATYQRVRDLYQGGMTVAAEIARELGVSASYAQRTLRRVKADLDRQQATPATTPERAEQATSDHQHRDDRQPSNPERSPDDPNTISNREAREATTGAGATRDGDGRATTTNGDRHLALVAPQRDRDHREVER